MVHLSRQSVRRATVAPAADDAVRSQALTAGAAHDEAVRGLQRLSQEHGGGVMGIVKGVLPIYVRIGLINFLGRDAGIARLRGVASSPGVDR